MPPRGGPRQAIKVMAVNVDNPDDVRSFDSYNAAARAFEIKHHSVIRKTVMQNGIMNGYRFTVLEAPAPALTSTQIDNTQQTHTQNVFTFWEEVDELFKGGKIRYTTTQPMLVSVYDIIKVVTGCTNTRMMYGTVQQNNAEVVKHFTTFQFSGAGERPTPVCDVSHVIELINVLQGARAARFRAAGAKVLVRFLGGDESLIDEIRENAEKQTQITEGPMRMFQLPNGLTGAGAACSIMLSPSIQDMTVADIRGACVYLIIFKHGDNVAIKFGWSKDLQQRVRDHYRVYPEMRVWAAIPCTYREVAEQTECLFKGKMGAYIEQMQLGASNKVHTEVLTRITPEEAERHLRAAYETVSCEHSVHNPMAMKELELRKLALEADVLRQQLLLQQAETEKLRVLMELHKHGISIP